MNRSFLLLGDTDLRLRRVGRLARRRMRIEGDKLANGVYSDGNVSITIRGLGPSAAGVPVEFEWEADRPIALVIVRSGIDGDDVAFHVGPLTAGTATGSTVDDGTGIRYIAFCYDTEPAVVQVAPVRRSILNLMLRGEPAAA